MNRRFANEHPCNVSMITLQTLLKAAGSGKWKPEMGLIAAYLTPWAFEMALVAPLPDIFFSAFWMLLNLLGGCFIPWGDIACRGVRSPGQCDLASGRTTMAEHHLAEFIAVCISSFPRY